MNALSDCTLCPRSCHVDRLAGQIGFCRQTADIYVARAALHFWEEPCISGTAGSGTVFFSGCNLQCVFCQNHEIARNQTGRALSVSALADCFLRLQAQGAHNINLVTPTHYIPQIRLALQDARKKGLTLPIVYNTSSYETVSSLRLLDGLIDIYLPDFKYFSEETAKRFCGAPDYPQRARDAIAEMLRQTGAPVFDPVTGLMQKGVIVRHLLLPGYTGEAKRILRYLHDTYGENVYISILNQYTPMPQLSAPAYAESLADINRPVTPEEYERLLSFADAIGIEKGFIQEGETAKESFIPSFDGEGL